MNHEPCQSVALQLGVILVAEKDSLHAFPRDESLRKKWMKAVKQQRSNWNGPMANSVLCSKHFETACFALEVVSCDQTTFFRFSLWWRKKGSGDLTIGFACDKITRFWRALIADNEPKRGVRELWNYVSQLYIRAP